MNRPPVVLLLAAWLGSCFPALLEAADRPNILWITAEDMSATLGCYGDTYATTPHIDNLAQQSVRYTHAFATAPVCSPARSALITGCYATSLGTHQMRSAFPLPAFVRGFPGYLRSAGYYTTNNVKTDYNTSSEPRLVADSWNESSAQAHWRNRPEKDQPFFSIFNLMTSHQSRTMVWPRAQFETEVQSRLAVDEIHDPSRAPLPPYYPDTPVIRRTVARYYDCVTAMDKQVGEILKQLEADGLAENTIVFFYSDHGSGMPRHKRMLHDSGMHVPLLVRFPAKYQHLAPRQDEQPLAAGSTTDRLVSFVDLGPTVLSLAGVELPDHMQGIPFLGRAAGAPREYVFGHRDRVDEVIDTARSVRNKRYLYIRNYRSHLGWNQPTAWPDQGDIRHEFYRLSDQSRMSSAQWQFASPTRPPVELYDCQADPHNIHNLADSPDHAGIRAELAATHRAHRTETADVGFLPEQQAWRIARQAPLFVAARKQLLSVGDTFPDADRSDQHDLPPQSPELIARRYWQVIDRTPPGRTGKHLSQADRKFLRRALQDEASAVRIVAAQALARCGEIDRALPVLVTELKSDDLTTVLYAARAIELLGAPAAAAVPAMRQVLARAEQIRPTETPATVVTTGDADLAMFIGFSARAFLTTFEPSSTDTATEDTPDGPTNGSDNSEWLALFDGKTLTGWTPSTKGDVAAREGEIQMLSKGANLWLVHDTDFADFELAVEVRMPKDAYNSGIGFRCTPGKPDGTGKPKGYQCEVARAKTGMIYAIGSGWVWPRGEQQQAEFKQMAGDCFQNDQWNRIVIRCQGDHLTIHVNGVKTADVRDKRFTRGRVALQHHGRGGLHRFRNIRLRKL